jgi:uncharacterized OB-fold protein
MTLDRFADTGPRPHPMIHPDTREFWAGLDAGELRIQVCSQCGTYRFPFAPVCFACLSFDHTWRAISSDGAIEVAVTVRRATGDPVWATHVPYISALVQMEHDLRLPGRVLCTCGQAVQHGAEVRAIILTSPDGTAVHGFAHTCMPSPAT